MELQNCKQIDKIYKSIHLHIDNEKTTSSPIIAALQQVEIKKDPLFSSFCIHLDSYDNIV
jgi:hypothetical protein